MIISFLSLSYSEKSANIVNFYEKSLASLKIERGDCNSEFKIHNLQSSDLLCPDPAMNAEQRYLGLLRKANRLVVEGTTLTLYSNNREILKFGLQ
jgi:hypothetical protein